ncbi:hypothetical protein GCK65_09145 [Aeromonas hydrophila]|nr:hypothetical protein GCK65_09145 [Aeromonas hydrophila]
MVLKREMDFLSNKPIEIELEGELLALDSETAPFYVDRPVTVCSSGGVKTAGSPADLYRNVVH